MAGQAEKRLAELGIDLPKAATPAANYIPFTIAGNILTISGQIPMGPNGPEFIGKLGETADVATGQAAARLCAINILAQAKAALGDLDRIKQVMKIQGFVNSAPDFGDQPEVINGRLTFWLKCWATLANTHALLLAWRPFPVAWQWKSTRQSRSPEPRDQKRPILVDRTAHRPSWLPRLGAGPR